MWCDGLAVQLNLIAYLGVIFFCWKLMVRHGGKCCLASDGGRCCEDHCGVMGSLLAVYDVLRVDEFFNVALTTWSSFAYLVDRKVDSTNTERRNV